jgi:peptide/nickel transport system permease protein
MEESPLKRFVADFCASKLAVAGALLLLIILFIAVFAPLI